jgi:ElaB/YqjD/DUF883 family membrane-anchored ribosome-binding protein
MMLPGNATLFPRKSPPSQLTAELSKKHKRITNKGIMTKQTRAMNNEIGQLADDARALMAATADVAGDKVADARQRLAAALESAKDMAGKVRDKALESARLADQTVRENPYQAIAIAAGVGAIIGYLLSRRCSRDRD